MAAVRPILRLSHSWPTREGAGVHLKRAFAQADRALDPFLLLDDFHSDDPQEYIAGFPWHPHRGIETITYVLHGRLRHGDSLGNQGVIGPGDVQWMTAGSGIIHEEMPAQEDGLLWGFQLWANLPAAQKMMPPRYREVTREQIPAVELADGIHVKIICGEVDGRRGPVTDIVTEPTYLDVSLAPNATFHHAVPHGHNAFAYVIEGKGFFDEECSALVGDTQLIVFDQGDLIRAGSGEDGVRFLLCAGKPLGEPIAWRGPIVMNSEAELQTAFREFYEGSFVKHKQE